MKDYKIILADDHTMMREGIRNLLNIVPGVKVIGEVGDGLELLSMLKRISPDMVILDISMPGLRGIESASHINADHPNIHILMLSMHKSEEFLSLSLAAGARGYLLKDDTGDELLEAIQVVRNGGTYLSKKIAAEFPSTIIAICRGEHKTISSPLTPRERQVLKLIAEGNTDRQISEKLCISVRTAHRHHANIRSKLKLKGTAALVRYAISNGYITIKA
jgi:DNA-binding NarL/FixJ family response regulator